MSFYITSIPLLKCFIRKEFLYNLEEHYGEFEDVMVFGMMSIKGRAPLFHVMLPNGAIYYRVPPHALTFNKSSFPLSIEDSVFWDSFSYTFAVHRYDFLRELNCQVRLKSGTSLEGQYLFTIDWCEPSGDLPSAHAELPDEHKCGHVIRLIDGNICIYPNNRILWKEASFIVRDEIPNYKTNTHTWYGEGTFKTEDSDKFFYEVE